MGRLQALDARWCFWVCLGLACSKEAKTQTTRERSEIVQATGSAAAVPASPVAVSAVAPVTAPARRLCEGQLGRPAREAPRRPMARKAALGAKPLGAPYAAGHWTWVNLWAAWCAPCKEEMPRLQSFAARIAQNGGSADLALAFVSLDDDERQLEQFLADQPDTGVRSTYWLREGRERDEWLAAAAIHKDPTLPVQLLVDPKGKLRCVVNGAVADQDYAEIAAIVSGP
jgi:thiol-disulfide isomerase/thioredoxin